MIQQSSHIKVSIRVSSPEQSEILLALLSEIGFQGFTESNNLLEAYIADSIFDAALTAEIIRDREAEFTIETIPQKNWNAEWEKNFQPVRIGDFCMIRAEFHPSDPTVTYDLVVQPKMSFGTGHHATTRLVIECMRSLVLTNSVTLDFGTGTGILAILAEKMGAAQIVAIDNDPWSIENAQENLHRNDCGKVNLQLAETLPTESSFSHILANINRNVLLQQLPQMAQLLEKDGVLIISGILQGDLPAMREKAGTTELIENKVVSGDSWVAVVYTKRQY